MIEKMTPSESSQQDLDVTEKLEGSYSMPGSPNYVPSQDIKVHMMKESTDPASAGKKEESAQETTMRMETVQEPEEKTADPEQKIPSASETPPQTPPATPVQKPAQAPTTPATEPVQTSNYQAPPPPVSTENRQAGGRKFPKVAFIGIGLLLLVLVYMMTKGGGDSDNETEAAATDPIATETAADNSTTDDAVTETETETETTEEQAEDTEDNDVSVAGPVQRPAGEPDTAEDLMGEWEGVVVEMGHYGPGYEDSEMLVHDLHAEVDIDINTGQHYFEAYLDDADDNSAILSTYIIMNEDHFIGDIGEEDAWILDHYLTPEENGYFYAKYDDPTTLYVQYEYKEYEEDNAGFHLSFYFRKAGESWNDLPFAPSYLQ
jgi:outer membrane biosynthesis protein TonB